jgi:glycosyltransferase involved in cell wall biosynthesis
LKNLEWENDQGTGGSVKNISLITDIPFWEMGNGQSARIRELYTFLANQSKLTLYYLGKETPPFPGLTFQNHDRRAQLASCLEKAQHDLIIIEKLHLDWVRALNLKDIPVYLDAHDLISERAKSFQRFNRKCGSLSFEEEIARFRKFDKIILLQKEETEKVLPFLGRDRLLLCPHPVVPEENGIVREEVETIGFFGGPSWPNIDGVQWFHDLILPLLGDLATKCVAHGAIVYSPFYAFSPRLVKGQLFSSLDSYYKNIDIAINPALYGSGLKIKTVEAIAYGIPLVTTSIGAQGLHEESGRSFLLADTPQEFAAAIRTLASSSTLRRQLSSRARAFARQHFTPQLCFASLLT